MKLLFVHQNFPGQYRHLAPAAASQLGAETVALTMNEPVELPGVRVIRYAIARGSTEGIHPWALEFESKVIRGEAAVMAGQALDVEGFKPDVICAHPGWGEALFLKDLWPDSKLLIFNEFYYSGAGADVGFDHEFPFDDLMHRCRIRAKNAHMLLSLEACDWAVSPTEWQRSMVPDFFKPKISVIFDGTDTTLVRPAETISVTLGKRLVLNKGDEVITFVNRNLEPYRGFHVFMRALPEILCRRPKAHVLIVGTDGVSYGSPPQDGRTWRQVMMDEVGGRLDLSRVHFLGQIPYGTFLAMLQISSVHIYLTYPFVLSWSMLEAMACECLVVGSRTPPVEEVIEDGVNGLLVDFFQPGQIAEAVDRVLNHPDRMQELRIQARRTIVDRYDLHTICLPRQLALIRELAERKEEKKGV